MQEFIGFPKIPRYSRDAIVSEKIDGTNAQIYIPDIGSQESDDILEMGYPFYVGSRTKWITPSNDNAGFARWAYDHAEELLKLGEGHHFGEWWGKGIQRNYGLTEKRFSLFNLIRWDEYMWKIFKLMPWADKGMEGDVPVFTPPPSCCYTVPAIRYGLFSDDLVYKALDMLKENGSYAVPGFMKPEGIVIFHTGGNLSFKKTFEKDVQGKGE